MLAISDFWMASRALFKQGGPEILCAAYGWARYQSDRGYRIGDIGPALDLVTAADPNPFQIRARGVPMTYL